MSPEQIYNVAGMYPKACVEQYNLRLQRQA